VKGVLLWLTVLCLVPTGCFLGPSCDEGTAEGASGNTNSLFYDFECIKRPGRQEEVNYAVFCESPGVVSKHANTDSGILTYIITDGTFVSLPYAKGRQFWVDAQGRFSIIDEGFSADELWRIQRLFETPGLDMKTLEDIKKKLMEAS
jgi:hypothetical protein